VHVVEPDDAAYGNRRSLSVSDTSNERRLRRGERLVRGRAALLLRARVLSRTGVRGPDSFVLDDRQGRRQKSQRHTQLRRRRLLPEKAVVRSAERRTWGSVAVLDSRHGLRVPEELPEVPVGF